MSQSPHHPPDPWSEEPHRGHASGGATPQHPGPGHDSWLARYQNPPPGPPPFPNQGPHAAPPPSPGQQPHLSPGIYPGQPAHPGQPTHSAQPYGSWPGYGPPQPYAAAPGYYSDKTKVAAGLLQLLPGFFLALGGIGRCYSGHIALGVVHLALSVLSWLLTPLIIGLPMVFGCWLWAVIDGIVLLAGRPTDAQGRLLR